MVRQVEIPGRAAAPFAVPAVLLTITTNREIEALLRRRTCPRRGVIPTSTDCADQMRHEVPPPCLRCLRDSARPVPVIREIDLRHRWNRGESEYEEGLEQAKVGHGQGVWVE